MFKCSPHKCFCFTLRTNMNIPFNFSRKIPFPSKWELKLYIVFNCMRYLNAIRVVLGIIEYYICSLSLSCYAFSRGIITFHEILITYNNTLLPLIFHNQIWKYEMNKTIQEVSDCIKLNIMWMFIYAYFRSLSETSRAIGLTVLHFVP